MTNKETYLSLDIGEKRIGVAKADSIGRLAAPLTTLAVDGTEVVRLQGLMLENDITALVVGLPRNQSGNETAQSQAIRQYVELQLEAFKLPIYFQDESVTSVMAEEWLKRNKKHYTKEDIDAHAAAIILQDFMDSNL